MITDYLIHQITIEPPSTADAWGNVAAGAPVTVQARVESQRRLVLDAQGQQIYTDARVFVASAAAAACVPGSWITYQGDRRQVVSVVAQQGLEGVDHLVAYLGAGVSG